MATSELTRPPESAGATDDPYPRRWWTLAVLCLSLLIVFVGNSSLNVSGLPASQQASASSSLAGAIDTASRLPAAAGRALTTGAQQAFIGGIHEAVTVGALLAAISAVIVYRWLPHQIAAEGAMHGATEAMEDAAELGIAGVPPLFPDTSHADRDEHPGSSPSPIPAS